MRNLSFFAFAKALFFLCAGIVITTSNASAQIKIGLNGSKIESSSLLELESLNQGLLLPRLLDTIEINALVPPDGMLVYITKTPNSGLYIRKSGGWVAVQLSSNKLDATNFADDGLTLKLSNTGNNIIFSANSDTSLWNANKLQGKPISKNVPLKGQLLEWNGSSWTPVNPFRELSGMTGLLNSSQLAAGSITTDKIPDGSITASKIGTAYAKDRVLVTDLSGNATWIDRTSFSTNSLNFGSIFIGDVNGVATPQYVTGDIGLSSSGVSSIGSGRVTTEMLLDGTIVSNDIANGAVSTDKLQQKSVTLSKLADIPNNSFLARGSTGSGSPEVISAAVVKNILAINKSDIGLANAENTSDANKPISTATQTALNLKAPLSSPTFIGTVTAPTFIGSLTGNASSATIAASVSTNANLEGVVTSNGNITSISNGAITNAMLANTAVSNLTGTNTGDQDLSTFAPLASPALTGSPTAPTPEPGTNNTRIATTAFVTAVATAGTVDADGATKGKIQLAGDLTGTAASPAIAASAVTAAKLAADAVTTTKIANGAVTLAKQADIATASLLGRNTAGTGAPEVLSAATAKTLLALTKTDVGLANVDNTSDASKPVSTLTQTALDLKAPLASPALTGVPTAPTAAALTSTTQVATTAFVTGAVSSAAAPDATDAIKGKIQLAGDLSGTASLPTVTNAAVIAKVLTGYSAGAGTVAATDNILGAIQKLDGNVALKAPLASPTFTGTVSGITAGMVGLGNVDNTTDLLKPISTATQAALDLKAPLSSPTLTGTPLAPTADPGTNTTQLATTAFVTSAVAAVPDADASTKGKIQLAGDLTGTAALPAIAASAVTTVKIADGAVTLAKQADIATATLLGRTTAGTGAPEVLTASAAKTLLALTKTDVDLANVDNTSDLNKPISTAAQASLDGKLDKVLKVAEIIVTSPTSTLAIKGLEVSSSAQNEVVTIDPLTGVLSRSSFVSTPEQSVVDYIAAEGQLLFTTPGPITTINKVNVYRNGIRINASVVDVNTIKLESGAVCYLNDEVKIIQFN